MSISWTERQSRREVHSASFFLHSSKELFLPLRILKAQTYHSLAGKPSAVSYHPEDPIQIPNMTCTVLVTWLLSILIPVSFRVSFAF